MTANPNPSKQVQEVICIRKIKKVIYPPGFFNDKPF